MAQRLILVAHGPTAGIRELVFGDRSGLLHPELVTPMTGRVRSWSAGPEPACLETSRRLGGEPEVLAGLSGPDFGDWAGCSLTDVGAADPAGLQQWLSDPSATPHGGESLTDLVSRIGTFCAEHPWSQGRNVVVVTALVARAMAVNALGAAPEVLFRLDLAPLHRVSLSRTGSGWRLRQLG